MEGGMEELGRLGLAGWSLLLPREGWAMSPDQGKQVSVNSQKAAPCSWGGADARGWEHCSCVRMRSSRACPGAPLACSHSPRDWGRTGSTAHENMRTGRPDPMGQAAVLPDGRIKNWQWVKNELFLRLPVDWEAFSRLHAVCLPRRKPCKMCWGRCNGYKSHVLSK